MGQKEGSLACAMQFSKGNFVLYLFKQLCKCSAFSENVLEKRIWDMPVKESEQWLQSKGTL